MASNHTDTISWSIEDLIIALSDTPTKKNKITIPKFQRTLVWKKGQQKEFIDSVKKGFPIGAILLYKSSNDIDGNIEVVVTGEVDTTTAGSYTLTYTATDAAGNIDVEERVVVVKNVPIINAPTNVVAPTLNSQTDTTINTTI